MFTIDPEREYRQIEAFYAQVAELLAWPDERLFERVPAVSGWSIAQHLEHLARANGRTFKGLRLLAERERPAESGRINLAGVAVLYLRHFPRGRAQSPDFAVPPDALSRAELERSLARNRQTLAALAPVLSTLAAVDTRMRHPVLGMLTPPQWLRFVNVHAAHHLRIIHDLSRGLPL